MTREERVLFIVFSRTQRTYIFSWKADADSHVLKTPLVSGLEEQVDSYSAVYTVAGGSDTQLADLLQAQAIDRVYVAGLALDYCVKFTAIDLQTKLKLRTSVLMDATRAVASSTGDDAVRKLTEAGVTFMTTKDLLPMAAVL